MCVCVYANGRNIFHNLSKHLKQNICKLKNGKKQIRRRGFPLCSSARPRLCLPVGDSRATIGPSDIYTPKSLLQLVGATVFNPDVLVLKE